MLKKKYETDSLIGFPVVFIYSNLLTLPKRQRAYVLVFLIMKTFSSQMNVNGTSYPTCYKFITAICCDRTSAIVCCWIANSVMLATVLLVLEVSI